jgi:hypothetical protein
MHMGTIEDSKRPAKDAADVLDAALKREGDGGSAVPYMARYGAPHYVLEITRDRRRVFAYLPFDAAKFTDVATWRASARCVEDDLELAVSVYLRPSSALLLSKTDGQPVLSKDQIAVLDLARGTDDRDTDFDPRVRTGSLETMEAPDE